jgi:hypothetical protein
LAGSFPECIDGLQVFDKIAVVTELAGNATPAQRLAIINGLKRYGAVLLDVSRFFTPRGTREEQNVLLKELNP